MSLLLAALLCAAPLQAAPAPARKGSPPSRTLVSTAAFALPLLAPTTAELTVPLVMERFERFDRDLNTLSAAFRQSVHSEDTGQTQSVEGTFDYRKKDRMRIEHRVPEPQSLVCDGAKVWVWRPANGQVIRSKLADWKRSQPLAQGLLDFGDYAGLLRRYAVSIATMSAPGPDGHRSLALALRPRAASGSGERPPSGDGASQGAGDFLLLLRLSTRDFFPYETELHVGAVTARTVFSGVRYNPDLAPGLFRFTPPAGADVLDFPAAAR